MMHEAARRVIFDRCFKSHCGLSHQEIEYFDHSFYYEQQEGQDCLERCYNTKMDLFFGGEYATSNRLYMNMAQMKSAYQRFERMNPEKRVLATYESGFDGAKASSVTESLLQKSRGASFNM